MKPTRTREEWFSLYVERGALVEMHALLTSGLHSAGYIDSPRVTEDSVVLVSSAFDLVLNLKRAGLNLNEVDRVVSPLHSLAQATADMIGSLREKEEFMRRSCRTGLLQKVGEGLEKKLILKYAYPISGERVLFVDDVFSTGSTFKLAKEIFSSARIKMLPFIGVLFNRSGTYESAKCAIVSNIDKEMPVWEKNLCPLCKKGSTAKRLRP